MKKPVRKRRGYAQGGQVDASDDNPRLTVTRDMLPNMTRPNPGWMMKEIPNADAGRQELNPAWRGRPMAKGGKVKKVVRKR